MSSNDIKITVDSIIKNGKTGAITMTGWALNQKLKQSPEIVIDDLYQKDVSIQRLYRMDVNTLFEVPNEENCGFEIKVAGELNGTLPIHFVSEQAKRTYSLKMNKMYTLEIGTETPTQLKLAKVKKGLNYLRKNGFKSTLQRYQLEKRIGGDEYRAWILSNETDDVSAFIPRVNELNQRPLISIIMPVYNVEVRWLSEAIDSLLKQVYPHWELCICDDASTSSELKDFLAKIAKSEERIKVVYNKENGHISKASNAALSVAKGKFVALMDNDDVLSPLALLRVAEAVNQNPDLKLIYSDEDKIDENGKRFEPAFKPDWAPDLLMGTNYISHLGVYERALVNEISGFRVGYEGAQDYDLVLRFVEKIDETQIYHIPEILYHWRALPGSTARKQSEKEYAGDAGLKALSDALVRRNLSGNVSKGIAPGFYDIRYDVLEEEKVSIIIPTKNGSDVLKSCVDSIIEKTSYSNYEIIIADNGSDEAAIETLYQRYQAKIGERFVVQRINIPFNFSRINNIAAKSAKGKYLLFLNNDTEVINPDWMTIMVSYAQFQRVGCVGAKLYYPDNTIQHAGIVMGLGGIAGHGHHYFPKGDLGYFGRLYLDNDYMAVTAACVMLRKADFEAVGGFDEEFVVAFNDVDLCLKVYDLGRVNIWAHQATLYHYESKTRGYENTAEKIQRFEGEKKLLQRKWPEYIEHDPFYNPNLTRGTGNFTVRVD